MLQIIADFLAEPITALYNKYLQSGEVPPGLAQGNHLPNFQELGTGGCGQLPPFEFNFCFV